MEMRHDSLVMIKSGENHAEFLVRMTDDRVEE